MTGIVCALDIEYQIIKSFFGVCEEKLLNNSYPIALCRDGQILIIRSGIGKVYAYNSCRAMYNNFNQITLILSAGIAGGLSPAAQIGQIILAKQIMEPFAAKWKSYDADIPQISPPLIRRFQPVRGNILCSNQVIKSTAIKNALYTKSAAICVDMESAGIAKFGIEKSIRIGAAKIISDLSDDQALLSMLRTQKKVLAHLGAFLSQL